MLFVTISPTEAAQYSYMCIRLKKMLSKMCAARETLEEIANTSFDKSFAKCLYLLASESRQCENEIRAQVDSLNCINYGDSFIKTKKIRRANTINGLESIYTYLEKMYLKSYKKLLTDKQFGNSLKSLMENHLHVFKSSLTQLRLFDDVQTVAN